MLKHTTIYVFYCQEVYTQTAQYRMLVSQVGILCHPPKQVSATSVVDYHWLVSGQAFFYTRSTHAQALAHNWVYDDGYAAQVGSLAESCLFRSPLASEEVSMAWTYSQAFPLGLYRSNAA